eukprot:CAMPEP_0174271206 /NCGR_PEP_ID=MMETSP0439-20130205/47103_1 /TAXON_ID=0 /ORGANISM="Stereomyxa ramosa, Strain Chinc5" /LENGTH=1098 /DNA_ID=CAMNT_0015361053 /DNA_START=51 /DNA_END=3347 /DNA_ORIENTATION=-
MMDKEMVGDYLLMDVIGRGAFGVVYRAVHQHLGHWVAIKQVKLNKKKKSQLSSLMMEIDLLKSLEHKNIVRYIDHILADKLNIIMEYVENGSLESVLAKHGKFPEPLVATYMAQVVEGVNFLHDQGVIHRDIKGANILISTSGIAKLADFGVSTKLSNISNPEDSFAGTPYWMAPEIIAMSGATTACDIWSIGCTIIELLTGTPPYGNLPAVASLYRIVQDDHPPLPERVTAALRDLLLQCFQKDPHRRITAAKMKKHSWLARAYSRNPAGRTDVNAARAEIKDYATRIVAMSSPSSGSSCSSVSSTSSFGDDTFSSSWSNIDVEDTLLQIHKIIDENDEDIGNTGTIVRRSLKTGSDSDSLSWPSTTSADEFESFELSAGKQNLMRGKEVEDGGDYGDDFGSFNFESGTIKVRKLPALNGLGLDNEEISTDSISLEIDDTDDFEMKDDVLDQSVGYSGMSILKKRNIKQYVCSNEDPEDGLEWGSDEESEGFELALRIQPGNEPYDGENSDPFDDDDFESSDEDDEWRIEVHRLENLKLQIQTWLEELSPEFDKEGSAEAAQNLYSEFKSHPQLKNTSVISNTVIIHLLNMLEKHSQARRWKVLQPMLQFINEVQRSADKKTKNPLQVNFCLLGGIPAITKFSGSHYPKNVRLEAARYINIITNSNALALHMFIACGGLSSFQNLLEPDFRSFRKLIKSTIDAIWAIFHLQILPKNDFCHLFTKCGLLKRLAKALTNTSKDTSSTLHLYKICDIFLNFSQASSDSVVLESLCQAHVLNAIKELLYVESGKDIKPKTETKPMLDVLLKIATHVSARDKVADFGFIPILVKYLERTQPFTKEEIAAYRFSEQEKEVTLVAIHLQVLNSLYMLCELNTKRQEQSVAAGVVPLLIYFIEEGHSVLTLVQNVALTIFLKMTHNVSSTSPLLPTYWKANSFRVYMKLLKNPAWYVDVLQSLLIWRRKDPGHLDPALEEHARCFMVVFRYGLDETPPIPGHIIFHKALEPFLGIIQELTPLAIALTREGAIEIIQKVLKNKQAISICINLLKILFALVSAHPKPSLLFKQHNLISSLKGFASRTENIISKRLVDAIIALNIPKK